MRRPVLPVLVLSVLVASVLVTASASAESPPMPKAPLVAPVRTAAVRVGVKAPAVAPTAHAPSSTQAINHFFESGAAANQPGAHPASVPTHAETGPSGPNARTSGATPRKPTPLLPLLLAEQDAKVDLARAKNDVFDARVKVRTIEAHINELKTGKSTMLRRAGNALTFGAVDRGRARDLEKELAAAKAEVIVAEQAVAPFEKRLAESSARVVAVLAERKAAKANGEP